jgi:hypothetical protein
VLEWDLRNPESNMCHGMWIEADAERQDQRC